MSRASAYRPEFALVAAGAVARSLVGRMRSRAHTLGPVAAVSLRVASRIANSLHAGSAVRSPQELNGARSILFHSPPGQGPALVELLTHPGIHWRCKSLVLCDSEIPDAASLILRERGASIASVKSLPSLGAASIEGDQSATAAARRVVTDTGLRAVEIAPGGGVFFAAAVTLCSGALTPLVDRAALLLRMAGLRDADAARLAARMVRQTAGEYSQSGRQSWAWHVRPPDPERLAMEAAAAPDYIRPLLRALILAGFDDLARHPDIADRLRSLIKTDLAPKVP